MAVLILAAVIDDNLYQSEARREDIAYVDGMFTLFRQASAIIGRQAGGRESGVPAPIPVQRARCGTPCRTFPTR